METWPDQSVKRSRINIQSDILRTDTIIHVYVMQPGSLRKPGRGSRDTEAQETFAD